MGGRVTPVNKPDVLQKTHRIETPGHMPLVAFDLRYLNMVQEDTPFPPHS